VYFRERKSRAEHDWLRPLFLPLDPYKGRENLAWAPNWMHSGQYAKDVLAAVKQVDDDAGPQSRIIEALVQLAGTFTMGNSRWGTI